MDLPFIQPSISLLNSDVWFHIRSSILPYVSLAIKKVKKWWLMFSRRGGIVYNQGRMDLIIHTLRLQFCEFFFYEFAWMFAGFSMDLQDLASLILHDFARWFAVIGEAVHEPHISTEGFLSCFERAVRMCLEYVFIVIIFYYHY